MVAMKPNGRKSIDMKQLLTSLGCSITWPFRDRIQPKFY